MSDESTVQLGYQELEDHNTLMQLIRTLIHRTDELQSQYETGGVIAHNESDTAHADIRQLVTNLSNYVDNLAGGTQTSIDLDNLRSEINDSINNINNELTALENRVNNINASSTGTDTKINNLRTEIINLINNINSELTALENRIDGLVISGGGTDTEVTGVLNNINSKVSALENRVNDIDDVNNTQSNRLDSIEQDLNLKIYDSAVSGVGHTGDFDDLVNRPDIVIKDADGSNSGVAVKLSKNRIDLKLPSTIKADIVGNITGNLTGSVEWTDITGRPTALSEFINDSEFLTTHQSLSNYSVLAETIKSLSISGTTITYTKGDDTTDTLTTQDTTYSAGSNLSLNGGAAAGLVPAPSTTAGTTKYLREDGTWQVPPDHTYTVNNATLTIQKNGTTVNSFTANASSNVTCNITVPTKVSELSNDSGFLTSHQSLSNYSTLANTVKSLSISGKIITVTPGSGNTYTLTTQDTVYTHPTSSGNKHIPSGGSSGQFLGWSADGTAKWVNNPNTNTTYSAGSNLSLNGTTFNVSNTPSFTNITINGYKITVD